jgi:hypothetical protein
MAFAERSHHRAGDRRHHPRVGKYSVVFHRRNGWWHRTPPRRRRRSALCHPHGDTQRRERAHVS